MYRLIAVGTFAITFWLPTGRLTRVMGPGTTPLVEVCPAQAAALGSSLASVDVDDQALTDRDYQQAIVAAVSDAAGASFDDLVAEARSRLAEPPWFLIARGLPAERATPILVAVSATLGTLVEPYQQPWSRVVRHIIPSRDRAVDGRVLNEFLHTDGTDWVRPNDYTCLFCVRPDESQDGESRVLDIATLLNEATTIQNPPIVDRLSSYAVPWRIADELGGGAHLEPVLDLESPRIRWLRHTIELAHEDGTARLSDDQLKELLAFEEFVENCRGTVTTRLQEGDLLLIDNGRALHARTPIRNPSASKRELRRTKVMRTG